jgi:ABC-type branched-subunit amino acid transport system substrate-binding protein
MKKQFLFTLFLLLSPFFLYAQSLNTAKQLYEQGDYNRVIQLLTPLQSQSEEARLLSAKSHFALNRYLKSINLLKQNEQSANAEIKHDALHTQALAHFQLGDFASALEKLEKLSLSTPSSPISREGSVLYNDILTYLTPNQRFEVFKEVDSDEIRLDLIESMIGKVEYATVKTMFNWYMSSATAFNSLRINRLETQLSDPVQYSFNPNYVRTAPKGVSYNIGVALPEFDFESTEYEIPQHLYFGIQLAVEQFNAENNNQKAFISYRSTNAPGNTPELIMSELVMKENIDVLIGPLFSQVAKQFSNLAEEYEVPVLLPLANADSLDLYNNYVFQLNPAFATQGKVMARYAVTRLGYDTLGVIAERRSLGAPAARAFRHEAERLGGYVEYYFEENLEELGYDIRDYTKFFTSDTLDSLPMVKAVYAPFTGSIAPTLVQSMLTDIEAMRSTVGILGSEEWQNVNLDSRRLDSTQIHFTQSFAIDTTTAEAADFISKFRIRFQTSPSQFAYIGFDAAKLILDQLAFVKNPEYLRDELKNVNGYRGLSIDVSFRGTHVNEAMRVRRLQRQSEILSLDGQNPNQQRRRR